MKLERAYTIPLISAGDETGGGAYDRLGLNNI
jgi:hypothetical protein